MFSPDHSNTTVRGVNEPSQSIALSSHSVNEPSQSTSSVHTTTVDTSHENHHLLSGINVSVHFHLAFYPNKRFECRDVNEALKSQGHDETEI